MLFLSFLIPLVFYRALSLFLSIFFKQIQLGGQVHERARGAADCGGRDLVLGRQWCAGNGTDSAGGRGRQRARAAARLSVVPGRLCVLVSLLLDGQARGVLFASERVHRVQRSLSITCTVLFVSLLLLAVREIESVLSVIGFSF